MLSGRSLLLLLTAALAACDEEPLPGQKQVGQSDAGPAGEDGGPAGAGDAGPDRDAGPDPDAGPDLDAGPGADAGPDLDGGPLPTVRFVALGDTGKGNQGQYDVAGAMKSKCAAEGCDFALLLGDNIYDTGVDSPTDAQFQSKFEEPYADLNLPFYVVLGNHDYGGNGTGSECNLSGCPTFYKGQYEVDYTAHSTKWKMPAAHYHFVQEHVELFALDTNMQMYHQDAAQKTTVAGWIGASSAVWKIALGHHPYLSNGRHGNAGEYDGLPFVYITNGKGVKDFMEEVICGQVDLYLCGHDHNRQWVTDTCNGTELAISGGGASPTALEGSNPVRFQADTLGFLYVKIEGRTITAQFLDTAGNVEFTRTITK